MNDHSVNELPDSLNWVNTRLPPSLASNRGKVTVIVFWSIANTQSWKLLPTLRKLENEFENGLMMVGIVCPKYPAEEQTLNVLRAVNRFHLRFPVALDVGFELWQAYGIKSWPSVAVVDAEGRLRRVLVGDDMEVDLTMVVDQLLDEAASKEIRNYSRVPSTSKPEVAGTLLFPTEVLAARELLYVSDSGNNRVLEIDTDGRVLRKFGSGNPGFWDGVMENCGFNSPNGLAYTDNHLYVADTGNHSIRRINLFSGEVETIVGNGKVGETIVRSYRELRKVSLNIPTKLALHDSNLFISVTGFHQIWRLNLLDGTVGWFSGSGQGEVQDGEALRCSFAQPTGMAIVGDRLFVADSDGCSIREVSVDDGETQTRVGRGSFTFGDRDGIPSKALLQYPTGMAAHPNQKEIWFVDTFNNKLRRYDLELSRVIAAELDVNLQLPLSVSMNQNELWVANTDAHEILKMDLYSHEVEKLQIKDSSSSN